MKNALQPEEPFPIPRNPCFEATEDERAMLGEILTQRAALLACYMGHGPAQIAALTCQCREIGAIHSLVASHDPHYTVAIQLVA